MARTAATKGTCYICKKEFGKTAIKNHLLKCNSVGEGQIKYLLIKVEGFYHKEYWLYLQIKENSTLGDLDCFLRNIWLECCGHLSAFEIEGDSYESDFSEDSYSWSEREVADMNKTKLKDVLSVGSVFKHDYDFGSTTTLKLTVMEKYSGDSTKKEITLLARNVMNNYICEECGEKATKIVMDDEWSESKYVCEDCLEKCDDEEMNVFSITNSPRMGVCGYNGENDHY